MPLFASCLPCFSSLASTRSESSGTDHLLFFIYFFSVVPTACKSSSDQTQATVVTIPDPERTEPPGNSKDRSPFNTVTEDRDWFQMPTDGPSL